jgi:thiosulfate/3-mercaptopyruvate sulfurtransferase
MTQTQAQTTATTTPTNSGSYAHPEVLVDTQWVVEHLNDSAVRVVEVDVDTTAYQQGHVPGAVGWNWMTQLCDTRIREIAPKAAFEELLGRAGIDADTTVVLYGDNNNWFAAWAFWQMKIYGHRDVRLMNGGRKKWLEEGRPLATALPEPRPTSYRAQEPDFSLRVYLPEVQAVVRERDDVALVDVRSPQEYSGEVMSPPGLPETCQRGGHIPGAASIPWSKACNDDGTFRQADELTRLYAAAGITRERPVIAYCRIGERSSHTWFVLRYLLGYPNVRNYDGSWTEWGNLVGAPVER